jgi:hypothetical protein
MKVTVKITGDRAILGSLSMLDLAGRGRLERQVDTSSARILEGAQERVPKRTMELYKTLRRKIARSGLSATIMAGYGELARKGKAAGARSRGLKVNEGKGVYAPVVEFGSQKSPAEPFLFPSLEAEKPAFIAGCGVALRGAVADAEKSA